MKVTLRNVAGGAATKDVEPSNTVADLKDICATEYDRSSIRLCHKGKVLEDVKTFAELGFVDGEVIIITGRKANIQKPPQPMPVKVVETPPQQPTPAPTTSPTNPATSQPTPSSLPTPQPVGPQVDPGLVDMITAMGFEDRNQITLALRAAYMNADRAVEYLVSGIPSHIMRQLQEDQPRVPQQQRQPVQQPTRTVASDAAPTQSATGEGSSDLRSALSAIPQFDQIRALVQSNPSALPAVMQQLQQHHPQVFEQVQGRPQEFLQIMGEGGAAPTQAQQGDRTALTQADREPIERLVALGGGMWDERAAAIVYLVCNRSEEVAANILFDNGGLPPELAQAVMEGAPGSDEEETE